MISVNIAMGLTVWDRSAAYWKSNHFMFPCAAVTLLGASICVYVCMNMFTSYKNLFTSNKGVRVCQNSPGAWHVCIVLLLLPQQLCLWK